MISPVNRLTLAVGMVIATLVGQAVAAPVAPSENVTINLIRLLVQQGVLTQDTANGLIAQAEKEAQQARQANAAPVVAAGPATAPGDVRVQYVPQAVRDQIRDQVKAEVMNTAKQENWAQPNTFPDWISRISFDGDIRLRDESRYFSGNNSNQITDYAKVNDTGPYDVNKSSNYKFPPMINTREDRENLFRLRARLGMKAVISPEWTAGIRLGTGSDNNPVSTTQTLGGGFGKKDIWLDQGYLTWKTTDYMTLTAGRFANPFYSTDMMYSNDLNFDHLLVLHQRVTAHDHREVRVQRFLDTQALFQLAEGDRVGIQEHLAAIVDGDGLGLGLRQRHRGTGLGQMNLNARHLGSSGEDEHHQHHHQHVHQGRDVDAVDGGIIVIVVGGIHGSHADSPQAGTWAWWSRRCAASLCWLSPCISARRVMNSSTNTRMSALTSLLRVIRRL